MANLSEVIEKKIDLLKQNLQKTWQELTDDELKQAFNEEIEQIVSQVQTKVDDFKQTAESELNNRKEQLMSELDKLKKSDAKKSDQ